MIINSTRSFIIIIIIIIIITVVIITPPPASAFFFFFFGKASLCSLQHLHGASRRGQPSGPALSDAAPGQSRRGSGCRRH